MNIEELRDYCLSLAHTTEKMPFDDKVLVFNVGGKMYCLVNIEEYQFINVKCEPEQANILRSEYEEVKPGYHMNKTHWNSIYLNGELKDSQIREWIKDSYDLVFLSLTKKKQAELNTQK